MPELHNITLEAKVGDGTSRSFETILATGGILLDRSKLDDTSGEVAAENAVSYRIRTTRRISERYSDINYFTVNARRHTITRKQLNRQYLEVTGEFET